MGRYPDKNKKMYEMYQYFDDILMNGETKKENFTVKWGIRTSQELIYQL